MKESVSCLFIVFLPVLVYAMVILTTTSRMCEKLLMLDIPCFASGSSSTIRYNSRELKQGIKGCCLTCCLFKNKKQKISLRVYARFFSCRGWGSRVSIL